MEKRDKNIMKDLHEMKIAVLMGGVSSEREISLKTGSAIEKALLNQGFQVVGIDVDSRISKRLREEHIDLAFLALHGKGGEDGSIQGLMEVMGIPYTGSGVLASALAFHKGKTKAVLGFYHIPTPGFVALTKVDFLSNRQEAIEPVREYPVVVKPCEEGSTIGVSLVRSPDELEAACVRALNYGQEILIEKFIDGREVTVGVLGSQVLPVTEIVPVSGFYDYESKYTVGKTNYLVPALMDENLYQQVQYWGLRACRALGCRGASRVDIMIDRQGNPFVLEVNTIPGMTETSLLPKAASVAGISFEGLVSKILALAFE